MIDQSPDKNRTCQGSFDIELAPDANLQPLQLGYRLRSRSESLRITSYS